jgi:ATP-dependent helicase HrpA
LQSPPGQAVGYKVRFNDHTSPDSYIKLMTDGILLAETQTDRYLNQYDTIIIDEAHERSLNIDFLLGYLRQLLPRRPDLKVIITSATINAELFSRHFNNAPVIEVSGRTYPVEIRHRPLARHEEEEEERDLEAGVLDAVDEASQLGSGDILVFLSGEREIRDIAEALRKHHPPQTEILPLFARLSAQEQERVFRPSGRRRIVLATNVAETSLTVPGIRYVIDPGEARIKRYSFRSKVERLRIEKISQASARQRAGRCGRIAAGVCIRLYSEEDYAARPEYTDPEIRRSNLAAVILRMQALRLGDINAFPFVEAPDTRMISDGYRLLEELGAVDDRHQLTEIGRQLGRLPVDPRIGRMLLAATQENCLTEMLVLTAALTVQDPRERPLDKQEQANQAHRRFFEEHSDFLGLLKLWDFFQEALAHKKSNRKLYQFCRANFLSLTRLREWRDVYTQLHTLMGEMGYRCNEVPATAAEIHKALLAGLLGNIGMKDEPPEYLGARNIHFRIFPGSALHKKGPHWLLAAEIVETSRIYARTVAKIEPEWIEPIAAHLVKRAYFDPHWEKKQAQAMAYERVTLYGLPIVAKRRVPFGPVDPAAARELFIRHALVYGEYETRAPFFRHNRQLVQKLESLEHKSRRRDILVDEEQIFAFYDERLPATIVNGAGFERWHKQAERETPQLLFLTEEALMQREAEGITRDAFPTALAIGDSQFSLTYRFEPGHALDGVTLTLPLAALNQMEAARADWLVPGMLLEKITALLRGLPQALRRQFVPVPDFAQAAYDALRPDNVPLTEALGRQLFRMSGVEIPADAWRPEQLPPHLLMNFRIIDADGKVLATGRDFETLRMQFRTQAEQSFNAFPKSHWEKEHLKLWDFGDLPESVEFRRGGTAYTGYPGLDDQGEDVALRLFDSAQSAADHHRAGVRRLFMLSAGDTMKYLNKQLPLTPAMLLQYGKMGNAAALKEDFVKAVVDAVFFTDDAPIRTQAAFSARQQAARGQLMPTAQQLGQLLAAILGHYHEINLLLGRPEYARHAPSVAEVQDQLGQLLAPGFLTATPMAQLKQFPRYLQAILGRLQKLPQQPARDRQLAAEIAPLWQEYRKRLERHQKLGLHDPLLDQFRWMLEELRVSLFAQELRTPYPVSVKRLTKFWETIPA